MYVIVITVTPYDSDYFYEAWLANKISTHFIQFIFIIIAAIYLFGILHRFQHCTGHITMGSFVGTGKEYI